MEPRKAQEEDDGLYQGEPRKRSHHRIPDGHILRSRVDLFNIKAIKALYAMRGLSEKRPLSLIFRDIKDISDYAVLTDFAFQVLKSTLPGAYTFVLNAKRIVPRLLMTSKKEVGVRMPDHPVRCPS